MTKMAHLMKRIREMENTRSKEDLKLLIIKGLTSHSERRVKKESTNQDSIRSSTIITRETLTRKDSQWSRREEKLTTTEEVKVEVTEAKGAAEGREATEVVAEEEVIEAVEKDLTETEENNLEREEDSTRVERLRRRNKLRFRKKENSRPEESGHKAKGSLLTQLPNYLLLITSWYGRLLT